MTTPRLLPLLALLAVALSLPGCSLFLGPVLPAVAPPPDVPAGRLLFVVPDAYIREQGMPAVFVDRKARLPAVFRRDPVRARQIRKHEIVTGMTAQDVVWAFLSHPTRIVADGPPGSHTMLWEQGAAFARGRYWVRTDQRGQVWAAGRF